ncbi:hypothetical protein KZJ38_31300 [Paraburkholderia edwinii]|uniref:YD repeat-containing protein n=1 Tax=Paraburkholderia edwinii TaxID=2861782 RepID=A0ABX8UR55_9BURK|nr:hypothetical protein [Paraburkholderia edwinii]QYD71503.1 hypothetical protein KZJ38_31300 [Paraburkholderia edwinii]
MNVTAPVNTFYANGNKQSEFIPNEQGGQAGEYIYYDENQKRIHSENRSVDGHVRFEHDYNRDGTTFSTTVTDRNGDSRTTVYGPR